MNLFFELGIVGIISYTSFLVFFIKENIKNNELLRFIFIILIPFVITTSLQYLGFDNDLVIMFVLILITIKAKGSENIEKHSKKISVKRYKSIVMLFAMIILGSVFISGQRETVNEVSIESNESIAVKRELYELHKEAYNATMDALDDENLSDEEAQVKISEARALIKEYDQLYIKVNNGIDNDVTSWGGLLDQEQQKIVSKYHKIAYELTTKALDNEDLDNEEIQIKINEARQAIEKYKEFYMRASEENDEETYSISWGVLLDGEQQKILDDIEEKINNYTTLKTENNKEIALQAIPESMPDIWKNELAERISNI